MLRTAQHPVEHPHPDAARIAGIGAAIVFNAALLLMLSRPIELAYPNARPEPTPPFQWIDVDKPKPVEVLPIVKPHQVVQQHEQTIPHVLPPPVTTQQQTQMSTAVVVTPPTIELPPQTIGTVDPTPVEASLTYRDASPPAYPRDALRNGIEGTVQLRVLVDETGHVLDVQIERSSGDHQLDTAAREHVLRRWLFQPAQRNGVPMRAWGRVPIEFRLDGR